MLKDLTKTQLYFQESVISMQQARANSNELIMKLDNMNETSKCIIFPKKTRK